MNKDELRAYFDSIAPKRDYWYNKNKFYHDQLHRLYSRFIPPGKSVLEIGCSTGNLLARLSPGRGLGIDFSPKMIEIARDKYPHLEFMVKDAECLELSERFDFVIFSDITCFLFDIWKAFGEIRKVCHPQTMVIVNDFNFLWQVPLRVTELLHLKMKTVQDNWLSLHDLENLLYLANFEIVETGRALPIPKEILHFTEKMNDFLVRLPFFRHLGLTNYLVAKLLPESRIKDIPCSVIIPCRNEAGNIEDTVRRLPQLSSHTEYIFVDGGSTDGTVEEIKRMQDLHRNEKIIKLIHQRLGPEDRHPDKMLKAGKGDAVRKGFDAANGEILMILDSDLTVAPEDLPRFYSALATGKAELANGSRLVYPLEEDSMRYLNCLANKCFGLIFSWLLSQPIKDTLCGTKALFKKAYQKIKENRSYFGDFDPFGDFDLLFGAARLNMKIVDVPIRYHRRMSGKVKIERFKHGLLLLKMSLMGFKKLKWGRFLRT